MSPQLTDTNGIPPPFHFLAGIMFVDRVETQDGFESHLAVNYLSHFLLTHLLLPSLKAAGKEGRAARVVNLTSSAQFFDWFQISDLHGKCVAPFNRSPLRNLLAVELNQNLLLKLFCFLLWLSYL